jgi:hypothetical protein
MPVAPAVVGVLEQQLDGALADREPHQPVTSCQMATRQTAIVMTHAATPRTI